MMPVLKKARPALRGRRRDRRCRLAWRLPCRGAGAAQHPGDRGADRRSRGARPAPLLRSHGLRPAEERLRPAGHAGPDQGRGTAAPAWRPASPHPCRARAALREAGERLPAGVLQAGAVERPERRRCRGIGAEDVHAVARTRTAGAGARRCRARRLSAMRAAPSWAASSAARAEPRQMIAPLMPGRRPQDTRRRVCCPEGTPRRRAPPATPAALQEAGAVRHARDGGTPREAQHRRATAATGLGREPAGRRRHAAVAVLGCVGLHDHRQHVARRGGKPAVTSPQRAVRAACSFALPHRLLRSDGRRPRVYAACGPLLCGAAIHY